MYVHYNNGVLRQGRKGEYVTTIHVINSAVVKLARQQPACVVYRGVKGGVLPKEFWTANAHGVMGGVELGMMSTTTERDVALEFASSGADNKKCAMVFEIRMVRATFCQPVVNAFLCAAKYGRACVCPRAAHHMQPSHALFACRV